MLRFDAVIFDLDGVITQTALVHGSAWKNMFDDFLKGREKEFSEPFKEFTHAEDYLPYVDGKPRYKGVASFLESRGIDIPFGDPSDDPSAETVCGLGNRKNILFNEVLENEGAKVYESSKELLFRLKEAGVRIGVASSSKNCKPVLERAGLLHLFETRIDGVVSAEIGLNGKPEPDIFTTACDRLGVEYHRSVVVEDAVSGVQAGKKGNFGLVIGVAREDNINELRINGGDIVVEDLAEVSIDSINLWFEKGMDEDCWNLQYYDYDEKNERSRETLLSVGNGYFGNRGALEESSANMVNYPGTYIAGLFNRLTSKVGDREIENEDFVNIPDWVALKFKIGSGEWFEFGPEPGQKIRKIHRKIDFKTGELTREIEIEDDQGRITRIHSGRFASMHYQHIAGIKYCITPVNYSDDIIIKSELSGNHINAGVERYKQLNQKHLNHISERVDGNCCFLEVRTVNSNITIKQGARHIINGSEELDDIMDCSCTKGCACQEFKIEGIEGKEIVFEKLVSIYSSQDKNVTLPKKHSRKALGKMTDYYGELALSVKAWSDIWDRIDVKIDGDRSAQQLIRLHLYHMMVTSSPFHKDIDAGIPPRGLHGEAYRGHIFWDELYILPLYNIHFPEIVKSVLMYRYRRLDKAKDYAREYGYEGAMFPWQSGSDGREETQIIHLNPVSGEWGEDYSSLQRHVSLAIAYNIWNYYWCTSDTEFMLKNGARMLFEICRFWSSKCAYDEEREGYHISGVMGPDEFHEKLPGSETGGLTDNAYTNIMVSWMMSKAIIFLDGLDDDIRKRLLKRTGFKKKEIAAWTEIKSRLLVTVSTKGIIEQFKGYFELAELDWDAYRKKYGDIHRLDRILKAEGKSPDDYKLSKQADLMMAFYNLGVDRVTAILNDLGYKLPVDYLRKNYDYYISRTSHGSTLSRLVHASLACRQGDYKNGWEMYLEALNSDLIDIQGGTTGEGIHCGVMAGTVYSAISVFGGLDLSGEIPIISPDLPEHWKEIRYRFKFRDTDYYVTADCNNIEIVAVNEQKNKIKVHIYDEIFESQSGKKLRVSIKKGK